MAARSQRSRHVPTRCLYASFCAAGLLPLETERAQQSASVKASQVPSSALWNLLLLKTAQPSLLHTHAFAADRLSPQRGARAATAPQPSMRAPRRTSLGRPPAAACSAAARRRRRRWPLPAPAPVPQAPAPRSAPPPAARPAAPPPSSSFLWRPSGSASRPGARPSPLGPGQWDNSQGYDRMGFRQASARRHKQLAIQGRMQLRPPGSQEAQSA